MSSIFISYRRSDSQADVGRIYDRLTAHFGREAVFKDVDNIPAGADFREFLNRTLNECKVLLAVIGPNWLNAADENGNRRLDNPVDWVRLEVAEALGREDVIVVPLLVSNAQMPKVDELPDGLTELAYRNSRNARPDPDFNKDINRLVIGLEQYFEQIRQATRPITYAPQYAHPKALEQYRKEVRQYLHEDNGEITTASRNLLNELQDFLKLDTETATTVEQEESQPYKSKAEAIARYEKVFIDIIMHESTLSKGTQNRLKRLQRTLGLKASEAKKVEYLILQREAKKQVDQKIKSQLHCYINALTNYSQDRKLLPLILAINNAFQENTTNQRKDIFKMLRGSRYMRENLLTYFPLRGSLLEEEDQASISTFFSENTAAIIFLIASGILIFSGGIAVLITLSFANTQ